MERLRIPSGVHFKPTDEVLVTQYLYKRIKGETLSSNAVKECCHVYGDKNPWEVFDKNPGGHYFYCFTKLKKLSKRRINRAAGRGGTWKGRSSTTGKSADGSIGWCKKDFVFETKDGGSADNGHWIMQEFSLLNQKVEDDVLCKISNNAKDPNKKKRGAVDEDPVEINGRCCYQEVVIAPTRDEIQCNHDQLVAAITSDLTHDDEEGDMQILHQSKRMRVSSPNTGLFDNRAENIDIVGNLPFSASSNLLFASPTEEWFQSGSGDVQQQQSQEFPVPAAQLFSFTDLLLSDDISSPSTELFDNRAENIDIVGNLPFSASSNLLFANPTEEWVQYGYGGVQQQQSQEFLPVPAPQLFSFTDPLLSDDISCPSTELFDNRADNIDIGGNLPFSASSNLLFASPTEEWFQYGSGDVQQQQSQEFLPVPAGQLFSFTDLLLSDGIAPEIA